MTINKLFISDIRSHTVNNIISGHFVAVAHMYRELFEGVCKVIIAGGPIYNRYFKLEELCKLPYNVCGTSPKDKWHSFLNARRLFQEATGQIIVMQQGTDVTSHLAISLFYHGKSQLYIIRYNTSCINSLIKRVIYALCCRKIDGVICPNDEVGQAFGRPYCVVPDYLYIEKAQVHQLTYESKKYDFCMVGRMCREKGMLEAAQHLRNKNCSVLIAGRPEDKQMAQQMAEICHNTKNITLILDYISDEDYTRYLNESRYCILNYTGEYSIRSSGVVFDTLFAGVPVIGRRCKALQFIEEKGLGLIVENISSFEIDIVQNADFHSKCLINIEEYRKTHQQYIKKLSHFLELS